MPLQRNDPRLDLSKKISRTKSTLSSRQPSVRNANKNSLLKIFVSDTVEASGIETDKRESNELKARRVSINGDASSLLTQALYARKGKL